MLFRYFSAAGRLARAQKKIRRGKFEDALLVLVGMLNKGVEPDLAPAIYLALAEAETGCGNLGNAGYYARQCEAALQETALEGEAAETLARARAILAGP